MKVAIIHDQLREFGGAERVLFSLIQLYPDADIYTSTFDWKSLGEHKNQINPKKVKTAWFGKIPIINKLYSPLRFLTPLIWESLDLSSYDLVISSTGSWMCKGVKTKKPTIHISYIHHPPRYLYGYETAVEWQKHLPIKIYGVFINHFLRMWDYVASQRPDYLIANSQETQKRIEKFYRRSSTVIYPPVIIPQMFSTQRSTFNYFITVSRLARAKHIEVLIQAANKKRFHLKIVGKGKDEQFLRSIAGPTIEFVGNVSDDRLSNLLLHAKAFLFASVDEEFGIAPIEAMGQGVPIIAYSSGGLKETIINGKNGFLYHKLSSDSLLQQIHNLNSLSDNEYKKMSEAARKGSEQYSETMFKKHIAEFVQSKITS